MRYWITAVVRRPLLRWAGLLGIVELIAGVGLEAAGQHPARHPSPKSAAPARAAMPPLEARPGSATDPRRPTAGLVLPDGTTQPVEEIAAFPDGRLQPPEDVSHIGWWIDSALPGSGS